MAEERSIACPQYWFSACDQVPTSSMFIVRVLPLLEAGADGSKFGVMSGGLVFWCR